MDSGPSRSSDQQGRQQRWTPLWVGCGCLLVAMTAATVFINQRPAGGVDGSAIGVPFGPWLLTAGGAVCLLAAWVGPRGTFSPWSLAFLLTVAVAMRAPLWGLPAPQGADVHRYLWDGAMVANGINPYRHTPREISTGLADNPRVRTLAALGKSTLEGINHPQYRTMYPPLAQGLFGLAHVLGPFSLTAWRVVLLAFDAMAATAVLSLLRKAGRPTILAALYLWNPLLIWETYQGVHMDIAAAGAAIGGVWLLTHRKFGASAVVFVLAGAIKLWPLLLLAFVAGSLWRKPRQLARAAAAAVAVGCVVTGLYLSAPGPDSGLVAYSRNWYANPGVFWLVRSALDRPGAWEQTWRNPDTLSRALLAAALLTALWAAARRTPIDMPALARRIAPILTLMLLLSPTLYPWYYIAVIPMAALAPSPATVAWTVLLPLCYWQTAEGAEPLRWLVVHLPVWVLLIGERATADRRIALREA